MRYGSTAIGNASTAWLDYDGMQQMPYISLWETHQHDAAASLSSTALVSLLLQSGLAAPNGSYISSLLLLVTGSNSHGMADGDGKNEEE